MTVSQQRAATGAAKRLNNCGAFSNSHREGRNLSASFKLWKFPDILFLAAVLAPVIDRTLTLQLRPLRALDRNPKPSQILAETSRRYKCVAGGAGRRGRLNVSEMAFWSSPTEPATLSAAASAEAPAASR